MRTFPLWPPAILALLLGACSPLAPTAPEDAPTQEELAEAETLFRTGCASCHPPPDPDHGTDVAWIRQVTDTA